MVKSFQATFTFFLRMHILLYKQVTNQLLQ